MYMYWMLHWEQYIQCVLLMKVLYMHGVVVKIVFLECLLYNIKIKHSHKEQDWQVKVLEKQHLVKYLISFLIQIAAGPSASMALSKNGHLYTWGSNKNSLLGIRIEGADMISIP